MAQRQRTAQVCRRWTLDTCDGLHSSLHFPTCQFAGVYNSGSVGLRGQHMPIKMARQSAACSLHISPARLRPTRAWRKSTHLLDLVVQHQHEGTAGAAQHVGQRALEERVDALLLGNLAPAVDGAVVLPLAARLQHSSKGEGISAFAGRIGMPSGLGVGLAG